MAAGRDDRERKKQVGKRVPKRVQRMNNKIPIVEEHGMNGGGWKNASVPHQPRGLWSAF